MKTLSISKQVRPLWMAAILCLPLIGGCKKSELDSDDTVRLSEISENTTYASMPLIGTKWKLIGFVDSKEEKIKLAYPLEGQSFTFEFYEHGEFGGYASVNLVRGKYLAKNELLSILDFYILTEAGEFPDGWKFIKAIPKISTFDISPKGLALHYETGKYLLFEPVE